MVPVRMRQAAITACVVLVPSVQAQVAIGLMLVMVSLVLNVAFRPFSELER